jgi:hypothetical protein
MQYIWITQLRPGFTSESSKGFERHVELSTLLNTQQYVSRPKTFARFRVLSGSWRLSQCLKYLESSISSSWSSVHFFYHSSNFAQLSGTGSLLSPPSSPFH